MVEIDLEERGGLKGPKVVVAHDVVGISVEYIVFEGNGGYTGERGTNEGEEYDEKG